MIVQEKILKEGDHLARRLNELGLGLNDYKMLDWNPMFGIIFYEKKDEEFVTGNAVIKKAADAVRK